MISQQMLLPRLANLHRFLGDTRVYIYTYYGIYTVLCRAAHAGHISFHLSESQVIAFVLLSGYMPFSGSEAVKISDPDITEAVPW